MSCPVSGQSHWILENNFSERITFIDEVQLVVIDSNIGEITHWSLSDRLSSVYHPHSNQHVALRVNNDPQEEHVGHGGEIRKHDQYRVKVDRSDQTTLRKCLFLLHREETIKHTQPPAFVICLY